MKPARIEVDGDIAVIVMDRPPVNALGLPLRRAIMECLDEAIADPAVAAVVLMGSERIFSAGADIGEMSTEAALEEPVLPSVIARIEACAKPVIAAIGGLAMGGGLELAMGAHQRIALAGARLALPEVKLGLLPGAGGTQRFARAVGLARALDFILGGEPALAGEFAGTALIARVVEANLRGEAVGFARAAAAADVPPARLGEFGVDTAGSEKLLRQARARAEAKAGHEPAAARIIDCLEAATRLPLAEGLGFERRAYLELRETPAHRGLRHAFVAERACARIPDVPADTPVRPIRRGGVVGGGTMGRGIAINFLNAGIPVVLLESDQAALGRAVEEIASLYRARVERGRITAAERDRCMGLLEGTLSPGDLGDADFIIEAVFEDMEVKQAVFRDLDQVAKPGAVLATNTSTLDVNEIAAATGRPEDVVGTHFFSPANVMRLCEVVRGARTSKEVLATAMQLARRMGKTAVVAGVCDGFIGNRMLEHYVRMAQLMVEEGASPSGIDRALEDWGMAMGPFRMGDLAGNDIGWAIRKRRYVERPEVRYARIADLLCERGRFGQKTGTGWYRYEEGAREPIADPEVDAMVAAYRAEHGIDPRGIGADEIVGRCIYALVNEGARLLEEGIALRASDIDVVYLTGYGFPRFRGGPMRYADEIGLERVAAAMAGFEKASGDPFWRPAGLIARHIGGGRRFTD
jgi:3-hydroxyacyl-CoA dehydrogenase